MPDAHGVMTQHDDLFVGFDFGQLFPPAKLSLNLPSAGVVVSFDEIDVLASNPFSVFDCMFSRSPAKIAEEVEGIAYSGPRNSDQAIS